MESHGTNGNSKLRKKSIRNSLFTDCPSFLRLKFSVDCALTWRCKVKKGRCNLGTHSGILREEGSSMRQRYQRGCLRRTERRAGPDRWEYLWREDDVTGKRVRRTKVIGTVEQYPTRDLAQAAANGLRMQINEDRLRQPGHDILVAELVDHYIQTELS